MNAHAHDPPAPIAAIRLTRCWRCGYELRELPAMHRCPECGFEYDRGMFVLEGWRLPALRASRRELAIYGGALILVAATVRVFLGVSMILAMLAGIAAWMIVAVALQFLRTGPDRASLALVRYLITEDGVARAGGRTHPWSAYSHLMLFREGESAYRLHLYPNWWRLFGPPMVNAQIDGSEREAELIRSEIQRRISAARRAAADARAGRAERSPPAHG